MNIMNRYLVSTTSLVSKVFAFFSKLVAHLLKYANHCLDILGKLILNQRALIMVYYELINRIFKFINDTGNLRPSLDPSE